MDFATAFGDLKATFEMLRQAIGMVRDVKGLLPDGEKLDAATRALDEAERHSRLAEAQVAKALGYNLCQCDFPPTPMTVAGRYFSAGLRVDIHECSRCSRNDAHAHAWERTVGERAGERVEPPPEAIASKLQRSIRAPY
jgi:hypothetical protein